MEVLPVNVDAFCVTFNSNNEVDNNSKGRQLFMFHLKLKFNVTWFVYLVVCVKINWMIKCIVGWR